MGFFATIIIAFLAATVLAVGVLAPIERLAYLIPIILIVGPCIGVSIAGVVAWLNINRPQNLMLGQISGDEYVAIETKVILGDSEHGERAVALPDPQAPAVIDGDVRSIASGSELAPGQMDQQMSPPEKNDGGVH